MMTDLTSSFDRHRSPSIGLEEEVLLVDGDGRPAPLADRVLARLDGDPRFKGELPLAQLEIVTEPSSDVPGAISQLTAARGALAEACAGLARPMTAGAHPLVASGPVREEGRYGRVGGRFGPVASLQLVSALQVHVALPGAERALAAYAAMRPLLAPIAALAANAPFHAGSDSGMASVRPLVCGLLPRQGVPPAIASLDQLRQDLAWATEAGAVEQLSGWWWEMRLHPSFGTLEVRVADAQTRIEDAAALVGLIACAALSPPPPEATEVADWKLAENRWLAARGGVEGVQCDLDSGTARPTRDVLAELLERCRRQASMLAADEAIDHAATMLELNGAIAQRRFAESEGIERLPAELADSFVQEV